MPAPSMAPPTTEAIGPLLARQLSNSERAFRNRRRALLPDIDITDIVASPADKKDNETVVDNINLLGDNSGERKRVRR